MKLFHALRIALPGARNTDPKPANVTQYFGLRREAQRHAAFERTKALICSWASRADESGAEATALQTLRAGQTYSHRAERLECGAFTAALARTKATTHRIKKSTDPHQTMKPRVFSIGNRQSAIGNCVALANSAGAEITAAPQGAPGTAQASSQKPRLQADTVPGAPEQSAFGNRQSAISPIDDDGWALIAPFGNHPKTRVYREAGLVKEQKFIQVLDNESADALMATENSFFRKLKRALVGIPVYKGHGDLNDVDPKAVANETEKIKLGVVDKIRKAEPRPGRSGGIEAHFNLDNDGAEAVAAGWKLPSAFWLVQPIGNETLPDGQSAIRARPFKLLSVALTQFPNISGVESLANAGGCVRENTADLPEAKPIPTPEPEMKLIAGWLLAQGVALANAESPTETQLLEALQKLHASKAADVTALGNEKSTLSGKIAALENSLAAQTQLAADHATALANEQSARQAERLGRAEMAADLAIQRGQKTVADRAATIAALANCSDFQAAAKSLLAGRPVIKTEAVSGRQFAAPGSEEQQTQAEYQSAFKTELAATGQDPVAAHNNIMRLPKYSGLAAKLVPQKLKS